MALGDAWALYHNHALTYARAEKGQSGVCSEHVRTGSHGTGFAGFACPGSRFTDTLSSNDGISDILKGRNRRETSAWRGLPCLEFVGDALFLTPKAAYYQGAGSSAEGNLES